MGRTEKHLFFSWLKRGYRRLGLPARLRRERLVPAAGVALIVGIGMALFAPFVGQSALWLGLGSGMGAFVMMLFFA